MTSRPRILDPRAIPIESVDAHLPALPPERLDREYVRARLAAWTGSGRVPGDASWNAAETGTPRPAAVLVPLVDRPDELTVLLTQRTAHLHDHAGQISFPGGRRDEGDHDAIATALRETEEEIGLARAHIDVLGLLPDYLTGTGYRVTPVVGWVRPPFSLSPDSFEVAEIFEVPLRFLMTPANHQRRRVEWEGGTRHFYAMPYAPVATADARDYFIWGATAGMLRNLYHLLADS